MARSPRPRPPEKCRLPPPAENHSMSGKCPSKPPPRRHPESPAPRSRNQLAFARLESSSPLQSHALRCPPRSAGLPHSRCSPPPPPHGPIPGSWPQSTYSAPAHTPDKNPASSNSRSHTLLHPKATPPVALHNSRSAAPFALPPAKCAPHTCKRCCISSCSHSPGRTYKIPERSQSRCHTTP